MVARLPLALALALSALTPPGGGTAQSVVVDEGTFTLSIGGAPAGTEQFTIRRAGVGDDAIVIANAVIRLDRGAGPTELRPLLEVAPLDDASVNYQLKISGSESAELSVRVAGRRYVARIRTDAGEEEREFLARPGTRIVEEGVAHQYYFLRGVRDGSATPVIEPRTRRQVQLVAAGPVEEELALGSLRVRARKVTLTAGEDVRLVWFDAQGRVLRVEIPGQAYVAERSDLVG
ncbi:MAG: hypothetical protein FIA95_13465 [Gemmatimonadetes bacterium]|nr:hypothetical protein [Gemmatimonadota bacterium]